MKASEFESKVTTIFDTTWNARDGQVVPKTDDVALSNGAVKLPAVLLYADLARSTELARKFQRSVAAKIVRAYLSSMTQLINQCGGEVRSFDGDRVMGVFVGDAKNSNAAKCALHMNYVVKEILRPKAEAKFPSLVTNGFAIQHCVGVSSSDVFIVRGGAYVGATTWSSWAPRRTSLRSSAAFATRPTTATSRTTSTTCSMTRLSLRAERTCGSRPR